VEELLAQVALRSPSARLTHSIWSEAAGHPFYTRELVRHVLDQGQLAIRATAESDASPAEPLAVPEGVQTLLDQRLSRLSAPAAGVLTTACVLAGGFGLPILQALTGLAAAPLSAALGEGLAAGLLRATSTAPAGFDFAHAIVRHALADRLTPDTLAALHRRAAEALEQLPASHAEHAAEIAAHYAASAALPGSERGIVFALAAAEHARTAFAHERVVACLRLARDLSAAAAPASRANILSQLAIAEASALYLADAPRTAEAAVAAILAHHADPRRAAELLASIARPLKDAGADTSAWEPLVERGLALVGDQHDLTWARLKLLQDRAEPVADGLVYARRWLGYDAEAVAIARRLGTEADYATTLETFDWRTPEETAQVLGLART
jgi:predicted ATPase